MTSERTLSTAAERRPLVVAAAIRGFARGGYRGTPVTEIAGDAGISQAYVFRLFGDKQGLFIEALGECFRRIEAALAEGADARGPNAPAAVLGRMAAAYAELITDHDLLMLQVHSLAACDEPAILFALRAGYRDLTEFVADRSGADDAAVQTFFARGQLCHLATALGVAGFADPAGAPAADRRERWARILTLNLRHGTRRR